MDQMDYKERLDALRRAGFTAQELNRLCQFRRAYVENQQDRTSADLARMQFIRWLVMNGRLTDQLS